MSFPLLRLAGALLAVLAAIAAYRQLDHFGDRQRQLLAAFDGSDLEDAHGEIRGRLRREPDPEWSRLLVSRALLSRASGVPASRGSEPGEDVGARVQGLREAREMALEVLRQRPAAWQGYMIVGASTYLEWSLTGDGRRIRQWRRWEAPLDAAARLAPNELEPKSFLAVAYLEIWPYLSPEKQKRAEAMLGELFAEPRLFRRLLRPWFQVLGDRDQSFQTLPDASHVWTGLLEMLAGERSWRRYRDVHRRRQESLARELRDLVAQAELRLDGGDSAGARRVLLRVIGEAPPERRSVTLLTRALALLPPAPPDPRHAASFRRWLDWALQRCRMRDCALEPPVVERLVQGAGELPPHLMAEAALAARDLAAAEGHERRAEDVWRQVWGPFLIAKSRHLVARNELAQARISLDRVHSRWRPTPPYLLAEHDLAQAGGDPRTLAKTGRALAAASRGDWPAADWQRADATARLVILASRPAPGLAVALTRVADEGGVVELSLDGAVVETFPVLPATAELRAEVAVEAGLHLVELRSLVGGPVVPGPMRLLD